MRAWPPILCLSRSFWSVERGGHRNRYQMLSRFARDRRVLMLECPLEIASLVRPRRDKLVALGESLRGPRRQPEGLATMRPLAFWLRDGDARAWRLNLALYRRWLPGALRYLGEPPIVWVYDLRLWPLLDEIPRALAAYHCTDDFAGMASRSDGPAVAAWVAEQERQLMRRVDRVFVVSEGLAAPRRALHPDVRVVLNGVDLRDYRPLPPASRPGGEVAAAPSRPRGAPALSASSPVEALATLPGPIYGYVGELNYRIDFPLLERVAERFPGGSLVLIGGLGAADDPAFKRLAARPNVHLLGHRPTGQLAAFVANLDVCLIPFVLDEWFIRAAQPLKTFEYLACGKPVVSTWLPNLQPWQDLIALTRDADEFVAACERALAPASPELVARRLAAARANSWDDRFAEVDRALAEATQPAGGRPAG